MNDLIKYLSTCLLATAALLVGASPAWAQVSLGMASGFSVLGGTAVTTSASTINGNVGSADAVTLTGSAINGNLVYTGVLAGVPPSTISGTRTKPLNPQVITDLNSAWTSVQSIRCTDTTTLLSATITGPVTLAPGVYCTNTALTGAGVLTLDGHGNPNAVWIFRIGAALSGTGFSVVMTNGGQPCNVFWVPGADVTMTTSAFSGNILAGANGAGHAAGGSITLNYGTLAGRALANTAVTMTGANIIGCSALPGTPPSSCKGKDGDGDDEDKDHKKCNQGVGNGPEGCDPGHSDTNSPFGSNDEHGGKPGDPGRNGKK
jgi:hypothetical protein